MKPSRYSWFAAYESAALETDFTRLNARVEDALNAIESRLDGPARLEEAEHKEIQNALLSLQSLSAERSRR
jgi:hypothetical protein